MTLVNFSSNSPRYLVPATKDPISNIIILLFCKDFGTSFKLILLTNSSTIAVLPTPASPTKRGLFLFFLINVSIIKLSSLSLPTKISSGLITSLKSLPILSISNF